MRATDDDGLARIAGARFSAFLAVVLVLLITVPVIADSITFKGSTIALRECRILSISGGQITYIDSGGQRQRRSLDDVQALGFDDLEQLDRAEADLNAQRFDIAIDEALRAMLAARSDVQRVWIHARLSRMHDLRGNYVQAAGHAAAVMAISEDSYWRVLEPISPPNDPTYAAAREAMEHLDAAVRKARSAEVKSSLAKMKGVIQPIHERLSKAYSGPPLASGSTISGRTRQQILEIAAATAPDAPPIVPPLAPSQPRVPAMAPLHDLPTGRGAEGAVISPGESPQVIDQLMAQQNWSEALARCEQIAVNPGNRELSRFLYQYGEALRHSDRPLDAAVMFTRCAALFPESPDASHALIVTAMIYRDSLRQPQTARRLLQRALDQATFFGHDAAAMLARELLQGT